MRISVRRSGATERFYAIKSTYDPKTKKGSTKVVAKLGTLEEIMEREGVDAEGARAWAKERIAEMTRAEKSSREAVLLRLRPDARIDEDARRRVSAGYLFPKKVCSMLDLKGICARAAGGGRSSRDVASVLETLVLGRAIAPASKASTLAWARSLIEPPSFGAHEMYRALSDLAAVSDAIQAGLYAASKRLVDRKDAILYYDCTNYFFECDEDMGEGGLRRFGASKERRPNPIVEMGLFMDATGMPLAFRIHPGNASEQTTMVPLEETIARDFAHSRFVAVTDAGLASETIRSFNSNAERSFICAQSVKKLPRELKTWAISWKGWRLAGSDETYDLRDVDEAAFYDRTFYKERWRKAGRGGSRDERLVATFSFKHREYQGSVRESQVERAARKVASGDVGRFGQNDARRLVKSMHATNEGELAEHALHSLDDERIAAEARFDGFSCIATDLEDDAPDILSVYARRWRIEECFRIMKTELKARPVYLSRGDRIRAHFLVCFIALLVYRIMDSMLGHRFTCEELLSTLRGMDLVEIPGEGWIPAYGRTEATDALHEVFGMDTSYEIVTARRMQTILTESRSPKRRKS